MPLQNLKEKQIKISSNVLNDGKVLLQAKSSAFRLQLGNNPLEACGLEGYTGIIYFKMV